MITCAVPSSIRFRLKAYSKMSDSEVDGGLSPTLSELSGLLTSRSREDGYDSNGETPVSSESV